LTSPVKNWIGPPPRSAPPEVAGYELFAYERLRMGRLGLLGIVLLPIWFIFYLAVLAIFGGRTDYSGQFSFTVLLGLVIVVVGVTMLHEALHGLTALLLGARPAFGAGPGYFYTTFSEPLGRWGYLAVGLTPLLVINAASIVLALLEPAWAGWLLVVSLYNCSGSSGDLWMATRIIKAPSDARFYDLADGFAVLVPAPATPRLPAHKSG
jgi:hypothetical protein